MRITAKCNYGSKKNNEANPKNVKQLTGQYRLFSETFPKYLLSEIPAVVNGKTISVCLFSFIAQYTPRNFDRMNLITPN